MTENNETSTAKSMVAHYLKDPQAFSRADESDDSDFYAKERIVQHLDSCALGTVQNLLDSLNIKDAPAILDLMASIDSHVPDSIKPSQMTGLGLNQKELEANSSLTEIIIQDINKNPVLPFEDDRFDIVLNTVSIQYVVQPKKLFDEVARVLKPGGLFLVVFSNRMFEPKAVKLWRLLTEDERVELISHFFDSNDSFETSDRYISLGRLRPDDDRHGGCGLPSDPIFAVWAEKVGGSSDIKRIKPLECPTCPSPDELLERKAKMHETHECPYCQKKMRLWAITENPMATWDHDLYICINDECPYLVKGWSQMYHQGNFGMSYRLAYDPEKGSLMPIPVPNLAVIKDMLKDEEK